MKLLNYTGTSAMTLCYRRLESLRRLLLTNQGWEVRNDDKLAAFSVSTQYDRVEYWPGTFAYA